MVSDYPLVDIAPKPAALNSIKYPMSGDKSHQVQIGVYDTRNSSILYLKIKGPKDQYLTNITWSPDEAHIYVAILNREQNHMRLNKYDVNTGELEFTLFEERNEKYVEPEHGPYFLNDNSKQFVWFSERSGYQHLYLYSSTGKLISTLTEGEWDVSRIIGNNWTDILLVEGSGMDGRSKSLYSVSLPSAEANVISGANVKLISSDKGYNYGLACKSGDFILKTHMSTKNPREISLIDINGKEYSTLLKADNPLEDYDIGSIEMLELKADDGTDLYARMIKPSHFDPSKKYPVLVYVYGGPHIQMVKDTWSGGAALWMYYMAEKGYLVFTLDNRGSANRGLAFEQIIHRQLGKVEMRDQLKGVEYLKSLNYVDEERLGVHGWSYGGYMTTSLMLHYPDVFKVGVAGGPVIDWKYYEVMYTERYMDTPKQNPEGYKETSLLNHVDSLDGDLMLIHGTSDDVVVWQHSLDFVKQCISEGKQIDYFVYPGHKHNVHGKDRVHLIEKILNYFVDRL
jgi:dipeptidyl-peptidase-4